MKAAQNARKQAALAASVEADRMRECTFQPAINNSPSSSPKHHATSDTLMYDRQAAWLQRKESKLAAARQEEEHAFSHAPSINPRPSYLGPRPRPRAASPPAPSPPPTRSDRQGFQVVSASDSDEYYESYYPYVDPIDPIDPVDPINPVDPADPYAHLFAAFDDHDDDDDETFTQYELGTEPDLEEITFAFRIE